MTSAIRRPVGMLLGLAGVFLGGVSTFAQPDAGASFRDCPQCPVMTPVAAGRFTMGSEGSDDASPTRQVAIGRFAYSTAKISVADWKLCVLAAACPSLGATSAASRDPVVLVTWVEVQQYLGWLGLETGADYRLLSEAEWEYLASRGAAGLTVDGVEWTSDCWHPDYRKAPADGSSWEAGGDCRYHAVRGRRPSEPTSSPVTKRHRFPFDARDPALGFRVARTIAGDR